MVDEGSPSSWDDSVGPEPPPPAYQPYSPPAGGYGPPSTPYGAKLPGQRDPITGLVYSDKERVTAGLVQLLPSLFGIPGIGRLYTGHTAIGLVQLLGAVIGWVFTCILIGLPLAIGMVIWGIVDGIIMLTSSTFTDANGRLLR